MLICGQHVLLRAIEQSDCDILLTLINDPKTERLLGGWSFPVSKQEQMDWIDSLNKSKSVLRTMITVNSEAVGTAILSDIDYKNGTAEIHIKLIASEVRGHGYGYDTIMALVQYAFDELRLHCIYAQVNEDNVISQKLFEKCEFHKDGRLCDRLYKGGKYISVLCYSLIRD